MYALEHCRNANTRCGQLRVACIISITFALPGNMNMCAAGQSPRESQSGLKKPFVIDKPNSRLQYSFRVNDVTYAPDQLMAFDSAAQEGVIEPVVLPVTYTAEFALSLTAKLDAASQSGDPAALRAVLPVEVLTELWLAASAVLTTEPTLLEVSKRRLGRL